MQEETGDDDASVPLAALTLRQHHATAAATAGGGDGETKEGHGGGDAGSAASITALIYHPTDFTISPIIDTLKVVIVT